MSPLPPLRVSEGNKNEPAPQGKTHQKVPKPRWKNKGNQHWVFLIVLDENFFQFPPASPISRGCPEMGPDTAFRLHPAGTTTPIQVWAGRFSSTINCKFFPLVNVFQGVFTRFRSVPHAFGQNLPGFVYLPHRPPPAWKMARVLSELPTVQPYCGGPGNRRGHHPPEMPFFQNLSVFVGRTNGGGAIPILLSIMACALPTFQKGRPSPSTPHPPRP